MQTFIVGKNVELIKNDINSHTGKKTLKGSKGIISFIPNWRNDVVDVIFEGEKSHKVIFKSDLKVI